MTATGSQDLIRRAQSGDTEAEGKLFNSVADRILLFIQLRLGQELRAHHDALDVLQETLFAAHQGLSNFEYRGPGSYVAWLCRIAELRIKKELERQGAQKRRAPGEREPFSAIIDRLRDSNPGPLTAAGITESREALLQALDREDENTRRIILGRFFEDLTFDEIGHELGASVSTIKRKLLSASGRLGAALAGLDSQS